MFILLIYKEYFTKGGKMVFKLKVRSISKEDEKNLYKKYKKIFKKNLKQKDLTDAICLLFLDLIYIYFDNKKRKK